MISISAFDLDYTLVHSNASVLFYRYLMRKGIFHPFFLFRTLIYQAQYYCLKLDLIKLHQKVFRRFLKGQPLGYIRHHVEYFLQDDFYRHLYFPAFAHLRRAQHEGHHTVIISNSPSFLVEPIAKYLGVCQWYSSHYLTDEKGALRKIGTILLGEEKAYHLRRLIQKFKTKREKVTAYSDSLFDLPFLHAAGKAVVVNPNGKMRRICREKKWEMI